MDNIIFSFPEDEETVLFKEKQLCLKCGERDMTLRVGRRTDTLTNEVLRTVVVKCKKDGKRYGFAWTEKP